MELLVNSYVVSNISNANNLNRSIWHIDQNLTGITAQDYSGPGNNDNKRLTDLGWLFIILPHLWFNGCLITRMKLNTELIVEQDNAIWTNHIKARTDKTQQNSKCRLCGDRDETINHIISECSKLAQKEYKVIHDWVGRVIHWEMCKKFKFDHTNKWYMHNPAPVLENDTHKLIWDFNMQTDHLISARTPDLKINKKKRDFAKLSTLLSRLTTE